MIILNISEGLSPVILSVVLIVYLVIVELGNSRIKKALFPFVAVLFIIFIIIAITSVYSTYIGIK